MHTFPATTAPDPHDYAAARRKAERERNDAISRQRLLACLGRWAVIGPSSKDPGWAKA